MAAPKLIGRVVSLVTTSPAATLGDIVKGKFGGGPELLKDKSSNDRVASFYLGDEDRFIEVTTGDAAFAATLAKGTYCATVVLTGEAVIFTSGTPQTAGVITRTLTKCTQVNDVEIDMDTEGKPKRWTLKFVPCKDTTGAASATPVVDTYFA